MSTKINLLCGHDEEVPEGLPLLQTVSYAAWAKDNRFCAKCWSEMRPTLAADYAIQYHLPPLRGRYKQVRRASTLRYSQLVALQNYECTLAEGDHCPFP